MPSLQGDDVEQHFEAMQTMATKSQQKPAFIAAVAATTMTARSRPPARQTTSPRRARQAPPKRIRVSELTRKYRRGGLELDEGELIEDARPHTPGGISSGSSRSQSLPSLGGLVSSPRPRPRSASVMYTRFPAGWAEGMAQMCRSVSLGLSKGFERLRVDILQPHLIPGAPLPDVIRAVAAPPELRRSVLHDAQIALLSQAAVTLLTHLFQKLALTSPHSNDNFRAEGAILLFDTAHDRDVAAPYLCMPGLETLAPNLRVAVLGEVDHASYAGNIIVLIAPSNCKGNPSQIELVEHVHYSNFNNRNWVIALNPDLVALTCFPTLNSEPRQPLFLADYLASFYLHSAAFPSKVATGAVLRCFPRKWELYLSKETDDMGFRLVSEGDKRPSHEKIHCEFSWRIEREMDLRQRDSHM